MLSNILNTLSNNRFTGLNSKFTSELHPPVILPFSEKCRRNYTPVEKVMRRNFISIRFNDIFNDELRIYRGFTGGCKTVKPEPSDRITIYTTYKV